MFVADATDGLAREREPPELRTLGRSIREPAVQRAFRDYVSAFVRMLRPEYVALSAETNLVRAIAPGPIYQGLSSYPYFVWSDPADLPDDYYSRLVAGRSLPVLVVEGGWTRAPVAGISSTPSKQARYLGRQAALLGRLEALALIQLAFTDIDLPSFPVDLRSSVEPFAHLGLVDAELRAKPALAVWVAWRRSPTAADRNDFWTRDQRGPSRLTENPPGLAS